MGRWPNRRGDNHRSRQGAAWRLQVENSTALTQVLAKQLKTTKTVFPVLQATSFYRMPNDIPAGASACPQLSSE
jgi:hypothetical protein